MTLALALDLGTTSIAAVAVSRDGRLVAQVQLPNDAAVRGLAGGRAEQDPRRLLAIAIEALQRLAGQIDAVPQCLGITGQMHGVLLSDAQRRPVSNLITWQDRRANEAARPGRPTWLEEFLERSPGEAVERTGCRPAAGYLGPTLFVLQQQQQMPAEARTASLLADWVGAELRGGPIVTDPGNAASTGVYDLARGAWSEELIHATGLPRDLLPPVEASGAVLGGLSEATARATGLPAGLPVCNAIGDNQAAVLGSVSAGDPAIQINVGTGGQINWPVSQFVRLAGMDTRPLPVDRYMLVGAGLSGGDAYAWVNRTVGAWLGAFGVERSRDEIYAVMNDLASRVPDGNDELKCEPLFRGTRRDPAARGRFTGVSADNFSVGHVARAVLEGIAAGFYAFYAEAGEWRPERLGRIIGSGNGLRDNPLLVRAIARLFERDVWFPAEGQEAARGAALLAGSATGVWENLEAAGGRIELVRQG